MDTIITGNYENVERQMVGRPRLIRPPDLLNFPSLLEIGNCKTMLHVETLRKYVRIERTRS